MENELEVGVDEVEEIVEEKDEDGNDTTDWKALALKNQGIAKRYKTKLEKSKEVKPESKTEAKPNPEPVKKEGFDYGELAFLTAKGIADEDISFVEEQVKNTGKTLKDLLTTKWFQAELKERTDERATKNAVPSGTKRAGTSSKDEVEYWIAKGELPPTDQVELRRKVNNELSRRSNSSDKSKFYNS